MIFVSDVSPLQKIDTFMCSIELCFLYPLAIIMNSWIICTSRDLVLDPFFLPFFNIDYQIKE